MQVAIAEHLLGAGFGRNMNEGCLVGAVGQVAINGVMAKIGSAAGKPVAERQVVGIQDLLPGLLPVNAPGFAAPEGFRLFDGLAVKILERRGHVLLLGAPVGQVWLE